MDSLKLVNSLKRKLGAETDHELAVRLGTSVATIKGWITNGVTEERLARTFVSAMNASQSAESKKIANEAIDSLREKMSLPATNQLANKLGISVGTVSNWVSRGMTGRKLADGLIKAQKRAVTSAHSAAIAPIVEYYPLTPDRKTDDSTAKLFPAGRGASSIYKGLKEELDGAHGIYIFYDSRGRALYVGKAQRLTLWKEMNAAYNRDRETQKVFRVLHPKSGEFKTSEEKRRQVKLTWRHLCHMAEYFSAYRVEDGLINELEALLVRSFANDVLNIKMERFGK
jgi:DNA-binding transcriptional regulator YiaG